ncbi:MAG: serine/threonine-protein kinase [Firmicutes bacterium]|nr:serine/threonine-protein kinase [Bacillota bacterium]
MKVVLKVTAGPRQGEEKSFDEADFFTVGRQEDCNFHLPGDPYLSRHHFIIEISPPELIMRDLGSTNGTFVNGARYGGRAEGETPEEAKQKAASVDLKDGDHLKVGRTEMQVKVLNPAICMECDLEIPEEKKAPSLFVDGKYLCESCRRKAAEPKPAVPPPAPEPLRPAVQNIPILPPGAIQEIAVVKPPRIEPIAVRPHNPPPLDFKPPQDVKKAERNPDLVIEEIIMQLLKQGMPGQKEELPEIAGYSIRKKLGAGGFGAVYLAVNKSTGKECALKTMLQTKKPNEKGLAMFEREIEITKALRHPNIVSIEDYGYTGGIHFFALELMNGGSVYDLMDSGKIRVPLVIIKDLMIQTLEGLAFLHKNNYIHRDLKPPNILISETGGKRIYKVSDFGLAKNFIRAGMTRNKITDTGSFCGSPPYIAPEHILNYRFLKPSTDVFEIGATFYHIITGKTVWQINPGQDYIKLILESQPAPIKKYEPNLPDNIAAAIDRSLNRDERKRYKDAGEMLKDMKKAV